MSIMESLPPELVEKILANMTYQDQGRILTVNKRWKMIIEGLLPPRVVNITMKTRGFGRKGKAAIGGYNLYSSYKGNPVYISDCTHKIQTGIRDRRHSWMYLFKMEKVWYERCEQRIIAQRDRWRWYVGENVGVVSIYDGFLQSTEDSVNPPENGSAWAWLVLHNYGWCGHAWTSHPGIDKIDFSDDEELRGGRIC